MHGHFNCIFMSDTKQDQENVKTPYSHCLNCGTELSGMYCHSCGQKAVSQNPTIGGFVSEYISNAFMWDERFFKTLWSLIRRPGHLTVEFLQGKFVSYVHPLKLNMFMLFVFITLFLMFADTTRLSDTVGEFTQDEKIFPVIKIGMMQTNSEYAEKFQNSPRDTVQLFAPLALATEFPKIITLIETIEDTQGKGMDKWTAAIPHVLIEENIVIEGNEGYLKFNQERDTQEEIKLVENIWKEMINIITRYFPIIILLTAPFLSLSLRLVQRKKKYSHFSNFIFALHYTAFIELATLVIYISHLIFAPSSEILQWVLAIGSIIYLSIAFRNAYKMDSMSKAIVNSLFTSIVYLIICLVLFAVIFLAACFIVVGRQ